MYWGISLKSIIVAIAIALSFASGWYVNGTRLNEKHLAEINKAMEVTKKIQDSIYATYIVERNKKDAEIRNITNRLNDALTGMRQRQSRSDIGHSFNGKTITGAELPREDAEFLIREAARADEAVAGWMSCYRTYELIRLEK